MAKAAIRKTVAEDAAFRLGALWEVFQGRWHVGAISREPANFVTNTKELLDSKLKDEFRSIVLAVNPDALTVPSHPTLAQIELILDPKGYNLTFKDAEAWMFSSGKYHSARYQEIVRAVVGDAESASLLHLLKSLRNLLAHGSYGSKASFNRACKIRPGAGREGLYGPRNDALKRDQRDVRDVGAYLRARTGVASEPRIETLHTRTIEVAEKLRAN